MRLDAVRRTTVALLALVLALSLAGCRAPWRKPHPIDKVLVFVVENHSIKQMRAEMPRLAKYADTYAYAANYHAVTHPSLPNYLAMIAGDYFGVRKDVPADQLTLPGTTVLDEAVDAGRSARVYADAMTWNCLRHDDGTYAVRHNAWTYFAAARYHCPSYDLPIDDLAKDGRQGRLPNVGFVIPDTNHDAHNAALSVADRWIADRIDAIKSWPDWKSGRLAIVVTADEDDAGAAYEGQDEDGGPHDADNTVLTLVMSRDQDHRVVHQRLDHYALSRFLAEVAGVPPVGKGRSAPSLARAFGITLARR